MEVVEALATLGPDAKVLAGGQSLVPLLNFRLSRPSVIIDLARVPDLAGITVDGDVLRIGAMARQRAVERSAAVSATCPILGQMLAHVGHVPIRNRGTVAGSIAHADPAAEMPAAAALLDAEIVVMSTRGERRIPARAFFLGPFSTSLEPDELVIAIEFPARAGMRAAFAEIARRHGDFAIAGIAGVVKDGVVRLAGLGVGWTPIRLEAAEAICATDPGLGPTTVTAAAAAARSEVDPSDDIHADRAYRSELVEALTKRVLEGLRS
jgi:carbon-monoxide dehydrogenase medium subunit